MAAAVWPWYLVARPLLTSSPRPRRAGGDGGGGAAPESGATVLYFLPRPGIAGQAVMGTDLVLLLFKVRDHDTKGFFPLRCRK
jgi:hypothetical protein